MFKNKVNLMALSVLFVLFVFAHDAQSQVYLTESFTGTTAPDWTFVTAAGEGPVLTAAEYIDWPGDGWLRLTTQEANQNSLVYYNEPITTNAGLIIEFDFVLWTPDKNNIADGIAVVLFDAAADPVASGGWGGSLGYAQHTDYLTNGTALGMNGGLVAFGFDTYGNFSNSTEGREGGFPSGLRPNSIVVRGSMGADRSQGYEYLSSVQVATDFSSLNARRRRRATVYNVRLTMAPDTAFVTIEMRADGGNWQTYIDEYDGGLVYPNQVKIGFTGSTGSISSYQEVRNLVVSPVEEPDCWDDSDCPSGDVCLGYVCEDPSLIELGSLEAIWEDDAVVLNWITDTELDNAYFNVYRAESLKTAKTEKKNFLKKLPKWLQSKKAAKKGPYVKINDAPLPALGESPYGAFYEVLDTDVEYGKRYWYKIEDVDLSGVATQHGPCGPVSAWEDCSYIP